MSKKNKPEIYISIDIETDGPCPGQNSMLALGAAAFRDDPHDTIGRFYATLKPLSGAFQDTGTMEWWTTQPEAWAEVNSNQEDPAVALKNFVAWCDQLAQEFGAKLIAVGWPIAF